MKKWVMYGVRSLITASIISSGFMVGLKYRDYSDYINLEKRLLETVDINEGDFVFASYEKEENRGIDGGDDNRFDVRITKPDLSNNRIYFEGEYGNRYQFILCDEANLEGYIEKINKNKK